MYMYEVWGRPAELHTCAVPELECQSQETPTCYTQSATGSRNQEFVPRCVILCAHQQPRHRLDTIPACAEPMRHNNLASLGSGAIRVKLHFTRIFNQHNYNTNMQYIHLVYQWDL